MVFLLSLLCTVNFLLLIIFSCSILFQLNQSLCFLITVLSFSLDTLYTIDLKAFHFSSIVPARISACLSFSKACRPSLTLLNVCWLQASWLAFCLPSFFASLVVWSVLQLAPPIALVFRKSGRWLCYMIIRCQCLDSGCTQVLWIW